MDESYIDNLPPLSRRQTLKLLAAGTAAVALPGLFGSRMAAAAMSSSGGQMVVGFSQEPTVFNPLMPHIEVDDGLPSSLFDQLFGVDEQGHFFPKLAPEVPTVETGGISQYAL